MFRAIFSPIHRLSAIGNTSAFQPLMHRRRWLCTLLVLTVELHTRLHSRAFILTIITSPSKEYFDVQQSLI